MFDETSSISSLLMKLSLEQMMLLVKES